MYAKGNNVKYGIEMKVCMFVNMQFSVPKHYLKSNGVDKIRN